MSGIGRVFADLELRNAATMRRAQAAYDGMDDDPDDKFEDDSQTELREIIALAEALIGRAERAIDCGDTDAARDLLIEAGRDLADNAKEVQ